MAQVQDQIAVRKSSPARKYRVMCSVLGTRPEVSVRGQIVDAEQLGSKAPGEQDHEFQRRRADLIENLIARECLVPINDDGSFTEPVMPTETHELYKRLVEQGKAVTPAMLAPAEGVHTTTKESLQG